MRICYIATAVSIHTQKWLKLFQKRGHEIHLIYFDYLLKPVQQPKIKGVHYHRIPFITHEFRSLFFAFEIMALLRIIKKIKPDIIHAHYISHYYCWYLSWIDFHPFVVSVLGSDVLQHPDESPSLKKRIKTVLKTADIIHVHSNVLLDTVLNFGAPHDRVRKIVWGLDLELFKPDLDKIEMRKQLKLKGEQIVICTRNFEPVYDVETFIKAIPMVINECSNVKFVIKGHGSLKDKLVNLTKQLGISDHVTFVGFGPYSEVPLFLSAADIYVSTSLSEGGSISLWEAMASGLPVVVTNLPANTEWIQDGINGFIVPTKDHKLLAKRIIELLKDKNKQKQFSEKNIELARKMLDQNNMVNQIEEIYSTLIEKYNK